MTRLLPVSIVNFWRGLNESAEDVRRWWAELRGRGEYISVAAVRKAAVREQAEREVLTAWDGTRAHPRRRAKLRKVSERDAQG